MATLIDKFRPTSLPSASRPAGPAPPRPCRVHGCPTTEEAKESATRLEELLRSVTGGPSLPCRHGPSLLGIGVLSMPVLVRGPHQRRWHRAVHASQPAVRGGRVCFRYIFTNGELTGLSREHRGDLGPP